MYTEVHRHNSTPPSSGHVLYYKLFRQTFLLGFSYITIYVIIDIQYVG